MKTKSIITALLVLQLGWAMAQTNAKTTANTNPNATSSTEIESATTEEIANFIEEPPIFPGGDDSMRAFIAKKVEYPKFAIENKIEGKIYIRFIVLRTGFVDKITVLRGVHPLLDSAAVAIVKKMPQWTPGKQGGKPVDVWYAVPVNFNLPENSKK